MSGQTGAGNFMLFAFTRVPRRRGSRGRRRRGERNAGVGGLALRDVAVADGAPVFTDDLAPIEEMTRRMLAER